MKIIMKKLLTGSLIASSLLAVSAFAADEEFDATIKLVDSITITEQASLRFPDQVAGSAATVVVAPADAEAAQFDATGESARNVVASVVDSDITMTTGDGVGTTKQILVNNFTLGGSVAADGTGAFDGAGALNNIRVGATANVEADDIAGNYSGTATFRLVYA